MISGSSGSDSDAGTTTGAATNRGNSSAPVTLGPFTSTGSRQLSVSKPPQFSQIGCHRLWIA
jgi:hypothetical protein